MATVYIKAGSGTGTGTASDPYFFSQLSTAESAAGAGGTILFTDQGGDYLFGGSATFNSSVGATYKSEVKHKAVLKSSSLGSLRQINFGLLGNSSTLNFQDFKCIDMNLAAQNQGAGEMSGVLLTYSTAITAPSNTFIRIVGNAGTIKFINNVFHFKHNSGNYFVRNLGNLAEFSGNSIFISNLNGKTGPVLYTYSTSTDLRSCPIVKNNIFATDDTTGNVLDTENSFSGSFNNCCFFQFDDSNNGSGGTDNVFEDPQFVDGSNDDLRLRPSSPCINAGTAS